MKLANLSILLITILLLLACRKDSSSVKPNKHNDLANLTIHTVDLHGFSDLMPPVDADPIFIRINLQIKNHSPDTVQNLFTDNVRVFLANDSLLGSIQLQPWSSIRIAPFAFNTITLSKSTEYITTFEPPCGKKFYITFDLKDRYSNSQSIRTDTVLYTCAY
ncbi:MAG: hypothetical protein GF313_13930 [Caldithrix sp.]|nr:hypothetical protein [Caldithrix sp.]